MVTDPWISSPSTTVPGCVIVRPPDDFRVTLDGTPVVSASGNIVATVRPFNVRGDLDSRLGRKKNRCSNPSAEAVAMVKRRVDFFMTSNRRHIVCFAESLRER